MRITASQLRKIIKEEIGRMTETYRRGGSKYGGGGYYGGGYSSGYDYDRSAEMNYGVDDDGPGESEADYEFRYGLKFPSSHPSHGQDFGSAEEGRAAYMAWKRSKA